MAWIESHQSLGHHPKTRVLAEQLGSNLPAAVGYVHYLWWWTMDYASDGRLPDERRTVVARACEWHGKPERFWDALATAGFIENRDGSWWVHDWLKYSGSWIEKRRRDAERKREERATHATRPTDDRRNGARTALVPDITGPDHTGPDLPDTTPLPPSEPSEGGKAPPDRVPDLETKTTTKRRARPTAEVVAPACCPNFAATGLEHWQFCPEVAAEVAPA